MAISDHVPLVRVSARGQDSVLLGAAAMMLFRRLAAAHPRAAAQGSSGVGDDGDGVGVHGDGVPAVVQVVMTSRTEEGQV